ncbi:shal K[+] channel interacting protein isoform X4 [Anticarsia gemmatalis]|uniref:shal K[+] channel interacting protein isoform X4 n=1 Tax=Anticarsia gemmatalis TaxID=129554 RepID=UPI003F765137
MASSASGNIVVEWLRSLHLGQYAESFIDNGYDDLEICKQVGEPDLDAIGVLNPAHRQRLLHSVRSLREEGAAAVYFTLEEAAAARDSCRCEEEARKEQATAAVEPAKYADEYEEGKAELVKIPRMQLKRLLRERLAQDGIRLSLQPYSTTDGDRGYLEGLASRYADLFSTHYGDVLDHLEELRRHEWDEMSPRMRVLGGPGTPQTPPSASPGSLALNNLTTSHSQPIYVPGKYSPSSCLTEKEEDEIYGFGYGVFGKQMLQRQQQQKQLLLAQPTQPLMHNQQHNYQSCLSPRSAYFYEFPPSDNCLGTAKKKVTTFSRLLRGLKSHRKEKHGSCSPKHTHSPRQALPPQRVDTPDSVLQSGLGLGPGPDTALRSMVDPRDYDRLRFFQMSAAQPNTFEETIHRLKVQEAMKKKDKLAREQEEILRDIRHGLMNMGRDGVRGPFGGTQALVRAGSNHSSLSAEENIELSPAGRSLLVPQMLCRARALVDYVPNIYEKDALRYKKGDIIEVINMNASGIWRGVLNNKVGNFKFGNVEVLSERDTVRSRSSKWCKSRERLWETRPRTVEELLRRIDLPEYAVAFARNGYEDIELFKEIEPSDLDYLGIMTPEHRTRILAAVQLLHQLECGEAEAEADGGGSSSEGGDSPFGRRQFPRDSGCYEAGVGVGGVRVRTSPLVHRADEPTHRPPEPAPQAKRSIRRRQPDDAECDRIERYPGPGTERTTVRSVGLPGGARDDTCESDHRLNVVKFVAGGEPCASEKSSDSGVSSSSLSSAHPHRP